MKTIQSTLVAVFLLIVTASVAQPAKYGSEETMLIPNKNFLQNADWERLFFNPFGKNEVKRNGLDKQVVIGPDERVYVSDGDNHTITILDNKGNLIRTFGKKGSADGEFINEQHIDGILDQKYLVISDKTQRISFFDLDGNFVKAMIIDFMPEGIYPLSTGKLILWEHAPKSANSARDMLAELDVETGKYTVFYEQLEKWDHPDYIFIEEKSHVIPTFNPNSRKKKYIRVTQDDKVVIGYNQSGIIKVFTKTNGAFRESQFNLHFTPQKISEDVKTEYYNKFKQRIINRDGDTSVAEFVKADDFFPKHLPYFYNMMLDEQNNALLFIYTNNENQDYAFQAYALDGTLLGSSEFKIDGYELLANKTRFIFKDGYIYLTALKKGAEFPLRILKCRVGK